MATFEALIEVVSVGNTYRYRPALIWLYDREREAITLLTLATAPSPLYADKYRGLLGPTEGQPTMDERWEYWSWHGGGNGPSVIRQPTDPFEAENIVDAMIHAVELALAYGVELTQPYPPLPPLTPYSPLPA